MKVTITAPDNLNEIKLGQYQEYLLLGEFETTDGVKQWISTATQKDMLRIFLYLDDDVIDKIPSKDVDRVCNLLSKLFEDKTPHTTIFTLRGKEWGFIPQLDAISYGENRDAAKYLADWQQMHKAMAVIYRPTTKRKGNKYLIEDYEGSEKYADTLKDMPLGVALGAMVFFWTLSNELVSCIPNFIRTQVEVMERASHSSKNGESITKLIPSLRETLGDLERSLVYHSTPAYSTWLSLKKKTSTKLTG